MKIFIGCSSKNEIDEKYLKLTYDVCKRLVCDNDLVFGADTNGMMGICYNEFKKNNKKITGIVNEKYRKSLEEITCFKKIFVNDTFDRTQKIYDESDAFLILPGGIGTLAELLSILENKRNNNDNKIIIVYNFDNYYDKIISLLKDLVNLKFIKASDLEYIKIVETIEQLDILIKK